MPVFGYAQGTVAGVSLDVDGDHTKCLILDGARLQSTRFVNQRISADGVVYTQGLNNGGKAAKFGLRFDYLTIEKFQDIITAINAAIDGANSFNVTLQDDVHTINTNVVVDGSDWLSYPEQRTNDKVLKSVTMRFLTT